MPLFPLFIDLSSFAVLIVGDGPEAERKAEILKPFCRRLLRTPYPPRYDERPALAVLAEKDHPDNEFWAAHFRREGIPVNVADRPELCDFRFPSLTVRGDVTVAVATDGKSPVLAALLRRRIEDALPDDLEAIAESAAALTKALRETVPDQRERTRILREELEKLL